MQNALKLAKSMKKGKFSLVENASLPEEISSMKVKLTEHECHVIEMLKRAADQNGIWQPKILRHLDSIDNLYQTILSEKGMKDYLGLEVDEEVDEKKGKGKKIEELRQKNTLDKIKTDIDTLKTVFMTHTWKNKPSFSHTESLEIKLLKMMFHIEKVRRKYLKDQEDEDEDEDEEKKGKIPEEYIYDLAFGCSKIISNLNSLEVKHKTQQKIMSIQSIQNNVVNDLKTVYERFIKDVDFDILHAAHNYPKFFIRTSYDSFLPGMEMSPYPSQLETIQFITKNKTNGFLLWLNTLTGEGKTSLVVSISKLCMNIAASNNSFKKLKVIYCCHEKLKTIKHQVGQYALKGAIPFALAEYDSLTKKITTKKSSKEEEVLIIADISSTISLLSSSCSSPYILFFDEPTFQLDQDNSEMIPILKDMFSVLPQMTILATATAPRQEDIPEFERMFLSKYPKALVHFISSTRVQIGSEICGFDGNVFLPHMGCKTIEELKKVVEKIKGDGFLQKCYTANVVNAMYASVQLFSKKYKFSGQIPDFSEYMSVAGNMNQLSIQTIGLKYLEIMIELAEKEDKIVEKFCNTRFTKTQIDFNQLPECFSNFENQTLVVTSNPKEFFDKYFTTYLLNTEKSIGSTFKELYKVYEKEKAKFEEKEKEVRESVEKIGKMSKDDREVVLNGRLNELYNDCPKLNIKDNYVIGSSEYFSDRKEDVSGRVCMSIEQINWSEISCEEKYQFGLALGVGILSPSLMSPSYTQKVIELASRGLLAYVLADEDICYGTNYPFENVIVDECLRHHSVKTIFQVFARAGRPGKSWKANIFAHSSILDIIRQYVFDNGYVDIETINILKTLKTIPQNKEIQEDKSMNVKEERKDKYEKEIEEIKEEEILQEEKEKKNEKEIEESWEDMC